MHVLSFKLLRFLKGHDVIRPRSLVPSTNLSLQRIGDFNATSEYQTFVDKVNDALLRVSAIESTVLMGDFNAYVGTDTDMWKGVIGKRGVTGVNENRMYLLQLCCSNGFRFMNTFFQHRKVHKYTWSVFPLALWLIGECPNFLKRIVPKALKRRLCALNFELIQY